ncbi:hypothetical protein FZEAL_5855, partial [Fusarium zealandicum]
PPTPTPTTRDYKRERELAQQKLESNPSAVSTQSSVRHVVEEDQRPASADHDMGSDLKHDIDVVKDTFRFKSVPKESRILGLAGTLPYLGTSLSTVFLAWDLNKEWPTGNSFYDAILVDHETAKYLLSVIEPIQLGYGAVIISFLGAIHWGLEYAEKQPLRERTRFRYGMGVASSVIAWPTLFLPVEYALTTQFMAFVALYFADARAATRGWAPHWYGTYRFLLTAMVGFAIFVSLVGRAKIGQGDTLSSQGLTQRLERPGMADHDTDWARLEAEEKERIKKEKKKQEEKEAKEAEKKEKEEKKKGGKGDKGENKAKASDEGSKKRDEEKSAKGDENKDDEAEKEDGEDENKTDEDQSEDKKDESEDKKDESKDKKDESKDKKDESKDKKDEPKDKKDESKDKKDESKDKKKKEGEKKDDNDAKEKDDDKKSDNKDSDNKTPKNKEESDSKDSDKKDQESKDNDKSKDGKSKDKADKKE